MNTSKMKTIVLVFLIAGVVLQTGKLWFEGSSGHNFFSSLRQTLSASPGERQSFSPYSFVINFGDLRYERLVGNVTDGDLRLSGIRSLSDLRLAEIIKSGAFAGTQPANNQTLLDRRSVLYEYPIPLSGVELASSFGVSSGDFRSRAQNISLIVITPARTSSESIMLYAVEESGENMHCFEGAKGVSDSLLKEIEALLRERELSERALSFISSEQNSLDFFSKNVFLPEWQSQSYDSYEYQNAYVFNPIEDTTGLERAAQLFFDNPVGLLTAVDPQGVPFVSDSETLVKYYEDLSVLEYTSYRSINAAKNTGTTLDQAYDMARAFMQKDKTLENDVVFVDAVQDAGGFTLFFEYSFGGLRAFTNPFGHAIEVTVSGGEVSKYRRIVKTIVESEIEGSMSEGFLSLLDRVLSEEDVKIDGLELGYDISENGVRGISWFVNLDGEWQVK